MSSQSADSAQSDKQQESQYLMNNYAKLNALRHDHNDLKKKYNAALAHNEMLKFSLETVKADFKAIVAAYEDLSESDTARRVEVETLKQACDALKRRNNELEQHNISPRDKRQRAD